jgi:hypothetical protein
MVVNRGRDKTSYTNTGLSPNTTYYFRVKASSAGGSSPYSNLASVRTSKSGTEAPQPEDAPLFATNSLQVSPNPAPSRTLVAFQVNKDQQVLIEVFDNKGNQVGQVFQGIAEGGKKYQVEWQAGSQPAGIYICRMVTEKETRHERIVLTR